MDYVSKIRPLVVINLLRSLRFSLVDCGKDLWASMTILFTLMTWILTFSLVGFYLFRYSFESVAYFNNYSRSFYSMFTALTTSNFPDVMLPTYHDNYWTMLFFIIYLLFGLYLLVNLLIANVFAKYKGRLEDRIV